MIKYDYEITVNGNQAKLNKDIYLFRGNKNVHYYFAVKNASFNFKGSTDLIEKTNAINAAVTVIKPNNVEVASAIAKVENGKIHLKVTEDLIDEEVEVGDFDLVFDLFDDTDGAVTIPKVIGQFHVLERPCTTPISELVATNTTNEVDQALTDYAITTYAEPVASTNEDGTFAKKTWVPKEKITTAELNRMEEGISNVSSQCKDIANKLENITTSGLTTVQINALDNMFKFCAYTKQDITTEYNNFKTAFGIGSDTPVTKYTITNNLTNCTNSNSNTTITQNNAYSAIITVDNGYTLENITVTMGGTDITSNVYSNGTINITNVTGDIVITGTAIHSNTPTKVLTSISATYSGGTVVVGTSLDTLKVNLIVTANYADSTSATITEYTLSGTIAEGSNTITVTYQGKTTTFTVTGTTESSGENILGELKSYKLNNVLPPMYKVEKNNNDYKITQNPDYIGGVAFQNGRLIGRANIEKGKLYKLSFTSTVKMAMHLYACVSSDIPNNTDSIAGSGSLIGTVPDGTAKFTFTAESNYVGLRFALLGIPAELKGIKLEEVI